MIALFAKRRGTPVIPRTRNRMHQLKKYYYGRSQSLDGGKGPLAQTKVILGEIQNVAVGLIPFEIASKT